MASDAENPPGNILWPKGRFRYRILRFPIIAHAGWHTQFLCQIRNLKFSAFTSLNRVNRVMDGLRDWGGGRKRKLMANRHQLRRKTPLILFRTASFFLFSPRQRLSHSSGIVTQGR